MIQQCRAPGFMSKDKPPLKKTEMHLSKTSSCPRKCLRLSILASRSRKLNPACLFGEQRNGHHQVDMDKGFQGRTDPPKA